MSHGGQPNFVFLVLRTYLGCIWASTEMFTWRNDTRHYTMDPYKKGTPLWTVISYVGYCPFSNFYIFEDLLQNYKLIQKTFSTFVVEWLWCATYGCSPIINVSEREVCTFHGHFLLEHSNLCSNILAWQEEGIKRKP